MKPTRIIFCYVDCDGCVYVYLVPCGIFTKEQWEKFGRAYDNYEENGGRASLGKDFFTLDEYPEDFRDDYGCVNVIFDIINDRISKYRIPCVGQDANVTYRSNIKQYYVLDEKDYL